ncbi:MAG TPA: CopG family transcriptional regulator [Woeseiaceae bacterium]|nr:CopG family transcriptional regulator [Woeseiaceae bacterium]
MEAVSIKLPAALRRRLAAEAKRRNMTQSAIVRESIEQMLKRSSGKGQPPSCAELVHDLVGSIQSGRSDLATNKAYLERVMLESDRRAAKRRR